MSAFRSDTPIEKKAEKPPTSEKPTPVLDREESMVAQLAFARWEKAGKPQGQWERYWMEAEDQVRSVRKPIAEARVDAPGLPR